MTSPYAYEQAHTRVKNLNGPARNHPCEFCGLRAHDWALDWESPDIVRDQQWRAYSPNPDWYMPLCRPCHKTYDAHVRRFGPDPVGVLRLRDGLWKATDPALRAVQRDALLNSFTAVQMWLHGADDVVTRRVPTWLTDEELRAEAAAPEPKAEPDWFPVLFTLDADGSVPGAEAYAAYTQWAQTQLPSREWHSRKAFYASAEKCGAARKRTNKGVALTGVKLK
ncbi:hypothetical protein KBZ00_27050 [Streptomyces sp. RK31]|uniref:hypothetical protein n=1 Tax=Streptomyces sp. RK31 TaxID=2824892 RepID=UPI001B3771B3|nr:hypothetical protein [Streptomyces sp. RK31]MBQ0974758.1 hypothetical protein [Streptomyces sp. RK31]